MYGTMNFLQAKFQSLEIEIRATNGYISEDDFINIIKEGLLQLGKDLANYMISKLQGLFPCKRFSLKY
jgi:hypothetical protein